MDEPEQLLMPNRFESETFLFMNRNYSLFLESRRISGCCIKTFSLWREYTEARTHEANLPARRPAEIPGEDVFIPFRAMYEAI